MVDAFSHSTNGINYFRKWFQWVSIYADSKCWKWWDDAKGIWPTRAIAANLFKHLLHVHVRRVFISDEWARAEHNAHGQTSHQRSLAQKEKTTNKNEKVSGERKLKTKNNKKKILSYIFGVLLRCVCITVDRMPWDGQTQKTTRNKKYDYMFSLLPAERETEERTTKNQYLKRSEVHVGVLFTFFRLGLVCVVLPYTWFSL